MEWVKCNKRLPEVEDDYLTYIMDNGCSYRQEVQRFYKIPRVLKGIYGDSFSNWELAKWDDDICIAWMPLPNHPQE